MTTTKTVWGLPPGKIPNHIALDDGMRADEGSFVVCNSDRLKYFTKGKIYKVVRAKGESHYYGAYHLQLEGVKGWTRSANFKLASKDVSRDISISSITGDDTIVTTKATSERKIDLVDNKEYQLFELLMNRIARDRNTLAYNKDYSSFDTMVKTICKGDRIFGLKQDDFDIIKDMSIKDLMDMFITVRKK